MFELTETSLSRSNCCHELVQAECLGLSFRTGDIDALTTAIRSWLYDRSRTSRTVGFLNPHVYNQMKRSNVVRRFVETCDAVCVDGVGILIAARLLFKTRLERLVATRLFDALLQDPEIRASAILIGATLPEVTKAAEVMNATSSGLSVIASYAGYFDDEGFDAILRANKDIDMVLVGAGSPTSERILLLARMICKHAICFHIGGGTIRIYAGTKKRAPTWLSAIGGEWLHRMILEPPTRSRYFSGGVEFAGHLLRARFSTNK